MRWKFPDPDLSDALHAALGSIRYAKSLTTTFGKNSLYHRLQRRTDEGNGILGEKDAAPIAPVRR
jgi:hypothetical protein